MTNYIILKQRKLKYFWLIWILLVLFGFSPLTFESIWKKISENDLVITEQACGCPCAEAKLVNGKINIPKKILNKHKNINTKELSLTGKTPFKTYNYEIAHSKILIEGEVIGVDSIWCSPNHCEIVPKFNITNWTLVGYLPRFLVWNKMVGVTYIIFILLSFFGLVIMVFCKKKGIGVKNEAVLLD